MAAELRAGSVKGSKVGVMMWKRSRGAGQSMAWGRGGDNGPGTQGKPL